MAELVRLALIALAAATAAALLFASLASGTAISVLLFYLSPLPILIAALGWSHWAALAAAIVSAGAIAAVFGLSFFLTFFCGVALPAWWLGYLALLARPTGADDALEWYPPGRLVFWAAVLGALIVLAAIPFFGTDTDAFYAAIRSNLDGLIRGHGGPLAGGPPSGSEAIDFDRLIDFFARLIPSAAAALTATTLVANLWLAGQAVRLSGRLRRPWPDLPALALPRAAPLAFAIAIGGSFFPGLIGLAAGLFAATLTVAYAVLGFAVLHATTRPLRSRKFILANAYIAVLVFGWPVILLVLLGLGEALFSLRARLAKRRAAPP